MIFFKCFAVSTISPKRLILKKVDVNAELVNKEFLIVIFNKMTAVLPKIRVLRR